MTLVFFNCISFLFLFLYRFKFMLSKFISSLFGSLTAFVIAIAVFAPDRIPPGWGFSTTPVEINISSDLGSELMGALTGTSIKNIRVKNLNDGPLHNFNIRLYSENNTLKSHLVKEILLASETLTIGWPEQWDIKQGDHVVVSAALYKEVKWAL